MFTSGEVAAELDVPPSTLRLYVKKAGKILSKAARSKSGRRFTALDVDKLRELRQLLKAGERFAVALGKIAQVIDGSDNELAGELAPLPPRKLVEQFAAIVQAHQTVMAAQNVELAAQSVALAEAKRRLGIIEAWLLLPAWRRLLTTPNLNKPAA